MVLKEKYLFYFLFLFLDFWNWDLIPGYLTTEPHSQPLFFILRQGFAKMLSNLLSC